MGEFMARSVPTWYLLVATFASTIALAVGGIVYTNFAIAKERAGSIERRCEGVKDEIEYFEQNPPETDRQRASQNYWLSRLEEVCENKESGS